MEILRESGRNAAFGLAVAMAAAGCRQPAPVPDDPIKTMENALAAAASASAAASAAAAAASGKPVLSLEAFKTGAPSGMCVAAESAACALDLVGNAEAKPAMAVKRDTNVVLNGWAADNVTGTVPPVVVVELVGEKATFYAPAIRDAQRPDVAEALKLPALIDSGFDALTSFKDVDPGEYGVRILQFSHAGHGFRCDTKRKLSVE